MRSNNLPHPSTLTRADWGTPHELVDPFHLVQNSFHLVGGLFGNFFNSAQIGTSWDETRYFHYVNTVRPWKAASLYREFRRSTLRDVKVDNDVDWYLSYLDGTGEFARPVYRPAKPASTPPPVDEDAVPEEVKTVLMSILSQLEAIPSVVRTIIKEVKEAEEVDYAKTKTRVKA